MFTQFYINFGAMKIQRFLTLPIILIVQFSFAQNFVQKALNTFASSSEFNNSGISFYAIDLTSGEKIAEYNSKLALPTASTAKLFSTASAIEILGPNYRPETRIYIDGKIDTDGTLNGNIWIRGGGDVSLGSAYFTEDGHEKDFLTTWSDTLQKLGIKAISGAIIADGSEFGYSGIPKGWSWNDMGNYYGAGASGISVFDNMVKFTFKTGSTAGSKTEITAMWPTVPGLVFHNYATSQNVSGDHCFIFGGPYSLDRFAEGSLPLNRTKFIVKGSLPDPEYQLAYEFYNQLITNGITAKEGAKSVRQLDLIQKNRYTASYTLLYTHKGKTIQEIANLTNLKSINLFAEGLLCLVGYKMTGNGSTEEGLKQVEKYWATKFSFSGIFLNDGSGLSRNNGICAASFVDLLKTMVQGKNYDAFLKTLPVAGKSGTLAGLCRDQPGQGRIIAKSGTMDKIKSYAGYVNSKSGKKIAFAFTVTNFTSSSTVVVGKMENVFNALAVY
jgi:D-alanyl-D-alanine carboxypeptidase/D-alanyl-D-alanine-endopeptidase (penicillin-binding protein 4)